MWKGRKTVQMEPAYLQGFLSWIAVLSFWGRDTGNRGKHTTATIASFVGSFSHLLGLKVSIARGGSAIFHKNHDKL